MICVGCDCKTDNFNDGDELALETTLLLLEKTWLGGLHLRMAGTLGFLIVVYLET